MRDLPGYISDRRGDCVVDKGPVSAGSRSVSAGMGTTVNAALLPFAVSLWHKAR